MTIDRRKGPTGSQAHILRRLLVWGLAVASLPPRDTAVEGGCFETGGETSKCLVLLYTSPQGLFPAGIPRTVLF